MPPRIHGVGAFGKRTKAYCAWTAMRNRCRNPRTPDYHYYGGRGIQVCTRWNSFLSFLSDMGDPPKGFTLDRKRRDGNYCRSNCRWATRATQAWNRDYCKLSPRSVRTIQKRYVRGVTRQVDLAAEFGVSQCRISQVVRQGGI